MATYATPGARNRTNPSSNSPSENYFFAAGLDTPTRLPADFGVAFGVALPFFAEALADLGVFAVAAALADLGVLAALGDLAALADLGV
eukprot:CAMPEP_0204413818 /NCGR_PEP_ID=MMETSP0470-20130426/20280_1 /ASSEMBLY_ACC=CAM_ASM_000385 /TAXON_ID=2969 /ORGANISM="Oxyrrhis marina" /LENGTH=87 /DNA_ID=CAMNT_0051410029 /DNA_START=12 /DNA_END=271 /DNA_ORIENTATION=-